jgi:hypothetical protein
MVRNFVARVALALAWRWLAIRLFWQQWFPAGVRGPRPSTRLALEGLEERWTPANVWIAPADGQWSAASNWSLGRAPTASDDVVFSGGTSNANCLANTPYGQQVASLTLENGYSGTLTLSTTLSVGSGGLDTDTGAINQGSGGQLTLQGGNSTWSGGSINAGGRLSSLWVAGTLTLTGSNTLNLGDTLNIYGGTVTLDVNFTGWLNLKNNAGINNTNGNLLLPNRTGISVDAGSTADLNNQGVIKKTGTSYASVSEIRLDIVNQTSAAQLLVDSGQLKVTGKGASNNLSIQQTAGLTRITCGGLSPVYTGLLASWGYNQDGGTLQVVGTSSALLYGDSVRVHGGVVDLGSGTTANTAFLYLNGDFTMDGGTLYVQVDATAVTNSQLNTTKTITLGTPAALVVTTIRVPAGGMPRGKDFDILVSQSALANPISGDFGTKTLGYPGGAYTAHLSADKHRYVLTS